MTYADETRNHYFALDSDHDLSAAVLELSDDAGVTWHVVAHTVAPAAAADFPPPATGLTRYWWVSLFGPAQVLSLTSQEQEIRGRMTLGAEVLYPVWIIYSDDTGPATPGCWPVDLACVGSTVWSTYTADQQERGILLAVATLRMLTANAVGGCAITVRPCRRPCREVGTYTAYPVGYGGIGYSPVAGWRPGLVSGNWINMACGCANQSCSCGVLSEVYLPGAGEVTEVKIDGAVLDPSAYRLDGTSLVRLDGEVWPGCQNMAAADTAPDTFSVTYRPPQPGLLGAVAAGRLAGEYAKMCAGQECAIPANVRTISRQGVTLDLAGEAGDYWPGGLTGIREVDIFIRSVNPHGLRVAASVMSVDSAKRAARRTG